MRSLAVLTVVGLVLLSAGLVGLESHGAPLARDSLVGAAPRAATSTPILHPGRRASGSLASTRGSPLSDALSTPAQESNTTVYVNEEGLPESVLGFPYLSVTWYVEIYNGSDSIEIPSNAGGLSVNSINVGGLNAGEWNYTIPNVAPDHVPYPSAGTFNLSAAATAPCCLLLGAVFSPFYTVTFNETGLPDGTPWGLTFNGTSGGSNGTFGSSVQFVGVNGSYSYSPIPPPGYTAASGMVTIDGHQTRLTIRFSPIADYSLKFVESGLDLEATGWSVSVNGNSHSSSNDTVLLSEPNGTYSFVVSPIAGQDAAPVSGNVSIAGSGQSVTIAFTTVYGISINVTGLPRNAVWYLNLSDGKAWSTVDTFWYISLPNGTYPYTLATSAAGYSAPAGSLVVSGAPSDVIFAFSSAPTSSSSSGLSPLELSAVGAVVVAAAVAGLVLLLRRRHQSPPPAP